MERNVALRFAGGRERIRIRNLCGAASARRPTNGDRALVRSVRGLQRAFQLEEVPLLVSDGEAERITRFEADDGA